MNLKELADERLAVLAVQNRCQAARQELVLRYPNFRSWKKITAIFRPLVDVSP